jgi:hypothetical protein
MMSENIEEGDIYSYSQDETYEEWIRPSSRLVDVCGKDMALCGHSRVVFGITYEKHERLIKEKDWEIKELKAKLKAFDDWEITENFELKHKDFGVLPVRIKSK